MIQKKWFRIETDSSGAILSCEEVSSKGRQGAVVRYYEALTKADACKQAKAWASNHRAKASDASQRRNDRLRIAGLCRTCGVRPLATRNYCVDCKSRRNARARELRHGAQRLLSKLEPESLRERNREHKLRDKAQRLARWGSIRSYERWLLVKRLDESPTGLRDYLCERIRKAGGGAALDEYERQRAKRYPPEAAE